MIFERARRLPPLLCQNTGYHYRKGEDFFSKDQQRIDTRIARMNQEYYGVLLNLWLFVDMSPKLR